MIRTEITARNLEVNEKLREYVEDKIGGLSKFLPRRVRDEATATAMLELDPSGREDNQYVCEVIVVIRGTQIMAKEATINIFASVDVVEAKLRSQLATYKNKHTSEPRRAKMLTRLMGRMSEADPASSPIEVD